MTEPNDTLLGIFCRQGNNILVYESEDGDKYSIDLDGRIISYGSEISYSDIIELEGGEDGECQ